MMILKSTADDPMLEELGITSGSKLLKVNGREVCDMLDYRFYSADDDLLLLFENADADQVELEISAQDLIDLDFEFGPDKPKGCGNKCVFCFIHQLPKGLRRSLYFKDEDFRLSFQHGNYITLTNLKPADFKRIKEQRLSPLYISVHTTDDDLRRKMLGNEKIPPLMPQMRDLIDSGITMHTQIVLCPGWNDGEHLRRTIDDLAAMYPGVSSVAAVPVGLTAHRAKLPAMTRYDSASAAAVLDELIAAGERLSGDLGIRFIYPADEFFLLAGVEIPAESFYDGFPQVENGVGMMRQLMDSESADGIDLKKDIRLTIATGSLVSPMLHDILDAKWRTVTGLSYRVHPVENKLMGDTVTVSGLLAGIDILDSVSRLDNVGDCVVVPPNCLNDDGLFLDDLTIEDIESGLSRPVVQAEYSSRETLLKLRKELAI
ncbi:MAG: DUF512 domain-containing protein [candidate division Zixibacteria bacterium]|nr:DUF512 domain-containing protein [candidate division Zixibacteria bacterium]MBU1469630.1 DUF512 domain-containing protein [candidate division Zixibacteria bacterium]MBU2626139.1 DUF512 domain-containing protein [candidate division Zixibacteria bacterium]